MNEVSEGKKEQKDMSENENYAVHFPNDCTRDVSINYVKISRQYLFLFLKLREYKKVKK